MTTSQPPHAIFDRSNSSNPSAQLDPDEEQAQPLPTAPSFHLTSYIIGLLTALILTGGLVFALRRPDPPAIVLHPPPTVTPTPTVEPTSTPAPLIVFVSGAVRNPGMYTVAAEARVGDALTAAGGMTLQANPAIVNQAERLWDGAQIHVPLQSVAASTLPGTTEEPLPQRPPTTGTETVIVNSPSVAQPIVGLSGTPSGTTVVGRNNLEPSTTSQRLNINTASPAELESLPSIGPSKAAAIVTNRPYSAIDDLLRVPGIGEKTLELLTPLITIE